MYQTKISGLPLAVVLMTLSIVGAARAEMLTNPGFEADLFNTTTPTGWTRFGTSGGTTNVGINSPHSGNAFLSMFQSFNGANNFNGVFQNFAASEGNIFKFSGYLRNGRPSSDYLGVGNSAFLKLEFHGGGGLISEVENNMGGQGLTSASAQNDLWVFNEFSAVAPAGTTFGRAVAIHSYIGSGVEGGSSSFDDLRLVAIPEPSTFILAALGLLWLSFVGWRRRSQ